MTKKDFFILAIKLFGLYSLVTTLFSVLPSNIAFALNELDVFSIIWITCVIAIVIGLFAILVFNSDKIVVLLNLDKGFENDRVELGNLNAVEILKIGTFIVGGIMLLNNVPAFLSRTFWAFKREIHGLEVPGNDNFYWAVSGLNVLIGYLLLRNYDFVANLLSHKEKAE